MFCILTPILAIPIIVTLGIGMRPSKKPEKVAAAAELALHRTKRSLRTRAIEVFWQLDFVGLVLLVVSRAFAFLLRAESSPTDLQAGSGLVLVTITIANSTVSRWSDGAFPRRIFLSITWLTFLLAAHSIAMLGTFYLPLRSKVPR